ncbi:MAG: orotate phosphoribosyltransferase [Litorivicinaceae bacterium]|nr:orotate phosphoribosyltransferase [Gammaproteobacteria bacterium]RPG19447.1 MAG: orotate phosphoribosyltransferase [Oceanospirillales bacterium TMED33]RZO75646.1 MAG: orotate phosphoribosyltransferase [Litorivicinaceae bacterium]CAI8319129.1 MAG: Orotate phosphoribosyltransferase [Gammaproteobacteria bacterium]|tara:strand:- start:1204 stop:1851 length:648 start_codon:yes stop_codon:yes gene_type:complete
MSPYKRSFLELALDANALKFGEYTLKSGRVSPYFFNASAFSTGHQLQILGRCYRDAIMDCGVDFDGLFGPAYKGIPLASSVAVAFAEEGRDYPVSFNRKEAKDHGEGGIMLGAPLNGRVLAIDDVVTAGTAVRGSVDFIKNQGASLCAFCVAVDRQERGREGLGSALSELSETFELVSISIVTLDDILAFASDDPRIADDIAPRIEAYRAQYGAL